VFEGVSVWPPDLAPGPEFAPVRSWDVVPAAAGAARRMRAPARVGASAVVMGLAARLWTVLLLPPARWGRLIEIDHLVVADDDGSVRLGLTELAWAPGEATHAGVRASMLAVLEPVVADSGLAAGLAWGNVAASLHAVPRIYGEARLVPWVRELLGAEPLAGRLEVRDQRVRRRSCCLFYLAEGGGVCGDCCFDVAPA